MKVIHTVRLHRTKGYPMDAVWFDVDPRSNARSGDVEVSASRVFDQLMTGTDVVARLPGGEVTRRCRAVTLKNGIETFELEPPESATDTTLRCLKQLVPYGADTD